MPENELTDLQKKKAGPEALLVVCKACAENCFVPGRVRGSRVCVRTAHCPTTTVSTNSCCWCSCMFFCFALPYSLRLGSGQDRLVLTPGPAQALSRTFFFFPSEFFFVFENARLFFFFFFGV